MPTSNFKIAALAIATTFLGTANAFWRLNCANIQYGRIDPIVNPGAIAAHVHTAQGGSSKYIAYFCSLTHALTTSQISALMRPMSPSPTQNAPRARSRTTSLLTGHRFSTTSTRTDRS